MAETATTGQEDRRKEALARYKVAEDAFSENRRLALEDMKFRALDQWPAAIKAKRDKDNRPILTVDKLNQYVRQVVNDGRQNRPAVKVRPVDDKGDPKVAEAFQGIIRHICNRSNADQAFDTALECAVVGGFGYFRIMTEYAHENTFNQEIRIKRIRNPLSVLLDPNAQEADGSDARYGFVIDEMPKDEFKKRYPNAKFTNWEADSSRYEAGWMAGENVRFCEYFYKVEEATTLLLLSDGTTATEEDYELDQRPEAPAEGGDPSVEYKPPIEDKREIPTCKVKWCRLSGAEILEENDWLGKYIPIIPVYGNEQDIEGKVTYSGLIRAGKDPQRLYNYSRSGFAERVALASKAPWVAAEGQIEGYEDDWENANTANLSVLVYKAIDINGHPMPAPQRQSPSDVPTGFAQDMQIAEHDIEAAAGMYAASVGRPSNEKSGKAIMARQREGDTSTFHYPDNLNRAICYMGRQLVDLSPKVYDSKRSIRILGEDGTVTIAHVDPNLDGAVDDTGTVPIYNLNAGTYDVNVESGPSYTTKRQEAAEAQMQLVQSAPETMQFAGDIIVKNFDWPQADELAERYKLMLPPQIQKALQEKDQKDPKVAAIVAQSQQMMDQAKQAIDQRDQALQQAAQHIQTLEQQLKDKQGEVLVKATAADTGQYKAETERMVAIEPAMTPENIAAIVQQTVAAILAAPSGPPNRPPTSPPVMAPMEDPNQPPPGGFFTP